MVSQPPVWVEVEQLTPANGGNDMEQNLLLVGVEICFHTLKTSLAVFMKFNMFTLVFPLLDFLPTRNKKICPLKKLVQRMFVTAFLIRSLNWKQSKCLSTEG